MNRASVCFCICAYLRLYLFLYLYLHFTVSRYCVKLMCGSMPGPRAQQPASNLHSSLFRSGSSLCILCLSWLHSVFVFVFLFICVFVLWPLLSYLQRHGHFLLCDFFENVILSINSQICSLSHLCQSLTTQTQLISSKCQHFCGRSHLLPKRKTHKMKLGESESQFLAGKAWRGIKRSALTKRNGDSLAKAPVWQIRIPNICFEWRIPKKFQSIA